MNIKQKNRAIIISSPSGAGKTTLCKLLLKKMKNIDLSISYTTRNQRLNEINGKDYKFVTKKHFIALKNKNYFIETALNFGNYYGSPFKNLSSSKRRKKDILFDIDWKGARKIRKKIKKNEYRPQNIEAKKKSSIKHAEKSPKIIKKSLVLVITVIAIIILLDTFKYRLNNYIPELDSILNNLYESLKDLSLFFNDLIN